MLDSFDLIKIQNLLNIKTQELRVELLKEYKKIGEDLTEHITESFISKVKSIKDIEQSKKIYSIQDHKNKKYIRNKDCWAYDIDLTAISPWNSTGHNTRAGTAITKHHIIYATHYPINIGSTVTFVNKHNEVIEKTLINSSRVFGTDITIGLLDSKLPDSIKPVKLLPRFWKDYVATEYNHIVDINNGILIKKFPVLCLDQEEKALIHELQAIVGNKEVSCRKSTGILEKFGEWIVPGDSGNPCLTVIDNELVLLCTWFSGGGGSGPFVSGDVYLTKEMALKNVLQEIQNKTYDVLFPPNNPPMKETLLEFIDLWRFRKVSP